MEDIKFAAVSGFAMPDPVEVEQAPAVEVEQVEDGGITTTDNADAIEQARARHNAKRGPVNPAAELRKADPLRDEQVLNGVRAARSAAATGQATELAQAFNAGAGEWWAGGIAAATNAAEAERVRQRERAEFLAGGWRDQAFGAEGAA